MMHQFSAVIISALHSAPAVFQNSSKTVVIGLDGTGTISLRFYIRSSSANVRVRWEKAGASDALQSHREEPGLVSLMVYGQLVSLPGTVTVLTLTDVRQADEGNYTVTVSSDINDVTQASRATLYVTVRTGTSSTEKCFFYNDHVIHSVSSRLTTKRRVAARVRRYLDLFGSIPSYNTDCRVSCKLLKYS